MFDAGSATSRLFLDTNPFRQGFLQAESLMRVFPSSVTNFLASPLLGVVGITGEVAGALKNMVTDALVTGVKLAASFEQAEVALGTMLGGGAAQAKAVLGDLSAFAAATPFELPELVEATKKLTAFGGEQRALIPTLTSIGDISAGLDIRIGDLADIYGKARGQGRLFMEDINQLAGRGIPIQQELARQFGVTADQVRKLVETGQVNFGNLQEAFKNLTAEGGKFGGMMEAQSKTLNGLWSTLTDNYNSLLREVGADLVKAFDLRGVIQSAADYILQNKGAIVGAVRDVTAVVVDLGSNLRAVAGGMAEVAKYAVALTDLAGLTSPENRTAVKNPLQGTGDPGFLAGLDKTSVLGTAPGREFLATLAREQLAAARSFGGVDDALGKLTYGDSGTRRASEIAAGIDQQAKGYRATLAELDALMGKPAAEVPAEQFDAVIAKVNAFGAALRAASAELEAVRGNVARTTGGGGAPSALESGIGGFTSTMNAIRSRRGLVSGLGRFRAEVPVAAEAATAAVAAVTPPQPVIDTSVPALAAAASGTRGGGGAGGGAGGGTQPLQSAFAALNRAVLAGRDAFEDVRDTLRDFSDDVTRLAVEVIRPLVTEAPAARRSGGGNGGPLALGNVNVTTPPFNMNESTSQVATKLRPTINQAFEDMRREFYGAIHDERSAESMRG